MGRPLAAPKRRRFDREAGVEKAQALFHRDGYDGVSVADLIQELDINPPSLYAAFGSKAGLYERALARYVEHEALDLGALLADDRPVAEVITDLLVAAARQYTSDPTRLGCLVTEGMGAANPEARRLACVHAEGMIHSIRAFITACVTNECDLVADFVLTQLRGLSAMARTGAPSDVVVGVARFAGGLLSGRL